MSKEREIAGEVVRQWELYKLNGEPWAIGALDKAIGALRAHFASTAPESSPAPQSESEAAGLLQQLVDSWELSTDEHHASIDKAREFLQRPPQSESEAVRLLGRILLAWNAYGGAKEIVAWADSGLNDGSRELVDAIGAAQTVKRPPGPDWRTLAENAANTLERCITRLGWNSLELPDGTHQAEQDIRDALASEAAAAGKGSK